MEQKKKNLLEMRKLGFSQKTLSLLSESQVEMILEKIKKKENKEATQTTTFDPKNSKDSEVLNKMTPAEKGSLTFNPDGTAKKTETTEGKKTKKKKKYNPWAVCTASVGRKNKKKYEDCVMGVKKKLKEGKNPYEYLIESKMEEIVENNLSPKMTKGEIMSIIAEKKMMMKKPIGKSTMIGGEMGESDTKEVPTKTPSRTTEKEPARRVSNPGRKTGPQENPKPRASYMEGDTKTAPTKTPTKTEPARRTANPGRKTGPQENPKPKAGKSDSELESKKSEIITAIFNLIDKVSK